MAYEERFVAFIDILGFKTIVDNTAINRDYQEQIQQILHYISSIEHENYHGIFSEYGILKEVSVFSDSIVLSYSYDLKTGGALFHILMDLVHFANDLISQGIFIRGGVTCGELYHNKNICFGPAMVKSAAIEANDAVFPRIVIEKEAIKRALTNPGQANTAEMEAEYLKNLIQEDQAGVYYLDFLSQGQEFDDFDLYVNFIQIVKNFIIFHLNQPYELKIKNKYLWFADYYNRTIQKVFKDLNPNLFIEL